MSINATAKAQLQAILNNPLLRAQLGNRIDWSKIDIMNMSEAEAVKLLAQIGPIVKYMSNPIAEGLQEAAEEDRARANLALNEEDKCRKHCENLRKNLPDKDSPDYEKAELELRMAEIDYECASMDREYRTRRANHTEVCANVATRRAGGFNLIS